jgi:protease IV
MRKALGILLLALTAAGCANPFRVESRDRITIEGPVETHGKIITEFPPVSDSGPVVAMPLDGCGGGGKGSKVAVIDVDGLLVNTDFTGPSSLGENPLALFRERLDAAAADAEVCALVVRINSPGGGVATSDMMWRDLQAFRCRTHRPVVACLMDLGTGGAYYLATASDVIVAHPGTITGGIGVILNLYNLRDLMAQYNVFSQEIKAGKNIDMGTSLRNLSPEAKDLLQEMAEEFHQRFQQVVKQARPGVDLGGGTTFDGRVFTARQALARRLIDRIGYLDDAVALARQLARAEDARVVLLHRANDPARSVYAVTPNVPLQATGVPLSLPGLERSRLPTFLYLWQPEATLERLSGK